MTSVRNSGQTIFVQGAAHLEFTRYMLPVARFFPLLVVKGI